MKTSTMNRRCHQCSDVFPDDQLADKHGLLFCQQCAGNLDLAKLAAGMLATSYSHETHMAVCDMIAELQSERDVLEGLQYINDFILARYQVQIETIGRLKSQIEQLKASAYKMGAA